MTGGLLQWERFREQERTSCTLGRIGARALWTQYSRRRAEGPSIDDEVLRRTCLDCAVDGTISGNDGGNGDTEGRTWKADRMGEGLPSCESKGGKTWNFKAACP
jgi:hypothetical protein